MTDLPLTLQEAAAALRSGTLTSTEITKEMLRRTHALNGDLGAFIVITDETALSEAAAADAAFAAGVDKGPLQGIPYAVKDIIATKDAPTTANSLVQDPAWGDGWDAPVVARLREAGAVLMGKTVLSEFACGQPDEDKPFPIPQNPWDLDRSAAGSSSGTGIAVSAGLAYCGLGTDTGGSIRAPGSHNGHTALMATYGRVPKSGCVALGYSNDHIGPHGRSAWDVAAMLNVIAGYDATDPYAADEPTEDYLAGLDGSVEGLRVGVPMDYFFENPGPDPETKAAVLAFIDTLKSAGAIVTEINLPYSEQARNANTITWQSEGFAAHRETLATRWNDYGQFTNQVLARGAFFTGSDYVQAQRFRTYYRRMVADAMRTLDVLVTPTSASPAPIRREMNPSQMVTNVSFTSQWDLTGQPAIAVPCGFSSDTKMPLSAQVVGKPFAEATILKVADAYQRTTDWHLQVPPITASVAV